MHEAAEGMQLGMNVVSTVGVGGVLFAAGNLVGRLVRRRAARDDPEVTDNRERHRFEIRVDGQIVGFAEYVRRGSMIAFHHTEIERAFQGRGLGKSLIGAALDAAGDERLWVQAYCPFVRAFMDEHPELALSPQLDTAAGM